MSGRKVAKRACDGCKIRKIKCTEVSPCEGCIIAGIACTFIKHPQIRGPRRLRRSTLQEITQTQQQWADTGLTAAAAAPPGGGVPTSLESAFAPSQIASLVLQLCVYRLRMYPVWPIIKVERLVAALQKPDPDIEVLALAYAVAAATIAQIKPTPSSRPDNVTAEMMESRCQNARTRCNKSDAPNITTLRISFFLHIYYENQTPGGLQSILYLREAITMSQVLGLHRQSYYLKVAQQEQQIRRRTFWLLFITERGVSVLHKLPVVLKTEIAFPNTDDTGEADVLIAFQTLVSLFWTFDQSGVFEILDRAGFVMSLLGIQKTSDPKKLESLSNDLAKSAITTDQMNDVQAVDIFVTRQWMRVILWRLTQSHGLFAAPSPDQDASVCDPVQIASELLAMVSHMPHTAIEAHGPGLELKIFEIASSVVDALLLRSTSAQVSDRLRSDTTRNVLDQLRTLLIRNKKLEAMLSDKIVKAEYNQQWALDFSQGDLSQSADPETQQQLQPRGFDFGQPLRASTSPLSESTTTDVSYHSPNAVHNRSSPIANHQPFCDQWESGAQEQQLSQQSQSHNAMWDSKLHHRPGLGSNITQDLFDQVQEFDRGVDSFTLDASLDSGSFNGSGWPGGHSSTGQELYVSPALAWQHAQDGPFDK